MDKRELTIEELEAQYKALGEQLSKKKKDEETKRKAQLALEKEVRKKEIEETEKRYCELIKAYRKDYGNYYIERTCNDGDDFNALKHLWDMIWR